MTKRVAFLAPSLAEGDKGLYERERFRGMMKELNLKGGTKLLEVLDTHEVIKIVDKCARL